MFWFLNFVCVLVETEKINCQGIMALDPCKASISFTDWESERCWENTDANIKHLLLKVCYISFLS